MKKGINNSGFRALSPSVQNNILSNMKYGGNTFAAGGAMPMEQLTEFDEGGRHEENGLGGIPQGMNPDGQMNLVEEGETKFDAENYIYSDSLKVDKELAEAFNLNPKMVGKTFADASKMAGRKKSKREGDAIEDAANEKDLTNLMEAQEAFKQARIEEKLQEIAELDPNALPALMGQGQPQGGPQEGAPQGDPAMGGQMQEAPMDEQAMMEQQMMAEQQQGGGQPSPEEMAMMEQQQNQMMGQQEGMMRNGGYTRSYAPGGFMGANPGMNMANAGAMGMSADPVECDCVGGGKSTACCETKGYDPYNKAAWRDKIDSGGNKIKLKDRKAGFRGSNKRLPFRHRRALEKYDVNYDHQTKGTRGGTNSDAASDLEEFQNAGMSFNYANIDMDNYTLEEQELMKNTKQPWMYANKPKYWNKINPGILSKKDIKQMTRVSDALSWTPDAKKAGNIITDKDRERFPGLSDKGIVHRDKQIQQGKMPKPIKLNRTVAGWVKSRLHPRLDPMRHFPMRENKSGVNIPKFRKNAGGESIKGVDTNTYVKFGGSLMQPVQGTGMNQMGTNMAQSGFNQNMVQPMNTMGKGGKMCYGCGGAMHNYGGRMDGVQHKYGAGLEIFDKITDVASPFLNATGVGIPVAMALKAAGNFAGKTAENMKEEGIATIGEAIGSGQMNVKENAINASLTGLTAGIPGVEALKKVPGLEGMLDQGIDMATNAITGPEEQSDFQIALENQDPKAIAKYNEMQKSQQKSNLVNTGLGLAGNIAGSFNPGEEIKDTMDSGTDVISDDLIPEMNFSKYGGNLMRGGGRLYNTGGPLTLKKTSTNPDGTTIERDVTYNSLEELLADAEMVNKYGGQDAIKANFSAHFSPKSAIPSAFTTPIQNMETQAARTNPNNIATQEDQNAMISYINQMKQDAGPNLNEQNMQNISMLTDTRGPNSLSGESEVPPMPVNNVVENIPEQQQQQVMPEEETVLDDPSKVNVTANEGGDDNEVDIDPNLSNSKKNISFKETPLEFASKMAGPLYNIGSGLLSKPKDYNPDYIPVDAPKLDATESINSIKRNVAGVRRSLDKVGNNPSQLLALAQTGSRLESQAIQEIDNINAKLEFETEKLNKAEKQKLNKLKKQLEMSLDEAKRKSIQEGIAQFGEIATTNQANKLAQQYASMGVDNIGGVDYRTYPQQLLDLIKENRKKRKAKKNN
jgi:hypothetical protein